MKVEARFGGGEKWFKGKVSRARSDGTFDILYEDGDTEMRVKRELVRVPGGGKKKKKGKGSRGSDSDSDADCDEEGDVGHIGHGPAPTTRSSYIVLYW